MSLIGKKVILLNPKLNDILAVGKLVFLGKNENLNWELQATINRTPYQIESGDQVVEFSERLMRIYQYRKYENN